MSAEIVTLHPRTDAPVQPHPRQHFGLKQPSFRDLACSFDETIPAVERPEDRAEQDGFKNESRVARAARRAAEAHVCPSLKVDLAARIRGVAQQLETLSAEAKSYGLTSTRVALMEHAGLLEGEAALVEAG